jgi:hypothetical protein
MAGSGAMVSKGIKDLFYETRVLLGRDYSVRRFAQEVLGGSVHPLILGYIEKGKRIPSEALVRRLAAVRREDPQTLLAVLWRDRMLHALGRELTRVLKAPAGLGSVEDADLAIVVSQAIAALPDDGSWLPVARWRGGFSVIRQRRRRPVRVTAALQKRAEQTVRQRGLVEVRAGRARLRDHHFVAKGRGERRSLALEFCALFAKGLLDKLALPDVATGTYLRNHFLHIEPQRLDEFQKRLDAAVDALSAEFAAEASPTTRFLNVLVTSTPV